MRYLRVIATPEVTLLFIRYTETGDKFWSDTDQRGAAVGAMSFSSRGAYAVTRGALPAHDSVRLLGDPGALAAPRAGMVPDTADMDGLEVAITEAPAERVYSFPTTLAEFRDNFGSAADALWERWVNAPEAVVELAASAQAVPKATDDDPVEPDAQDTEGFREAFPGEDPNRLRAARARSRRE